MNRPKARLGFRHTTRESYADGHRDAIANDAIADTSVRQRVVRREVRVHVGDRRRGSQQLRCDDELLPGRRRGGPVYQMVLRGLRLVVMYHVTAHPWTYDEKTRKPEDPDRSSYAHVPRARRCQASGACVRPAAALRLANGTSSDSVTPCCSVSRRLGVVCAALRVAFTGPGGPWSAAAGTVDGRGFEEPGAEREREPRETRPYPATATGVPARFLRVLFIVRACCCLPVFNNWFGDGEDVGAAVPCPCFVFRSCCFVSGYALRAYYACCKLVAC